MGTGPEGNGRERREDERKDVSLEAWWEGLSGRHEARVSDISMGGCFVDTHAPAEVGELIVFAIRKPDGSWLELRGRVVSRGPHFGFSLAYTFLTDEEQQELRRLGAI
ncbi:MAG TPA: PilZ domain-containing protein [Pyrinomonadaceae bacterium]|nr:PilZ domain-containing protein [Pyrinomonadaceae bacterium]